MKHVWSIAAKELRGYFNSAVALIFLAAFLAFTLFAFFWVDTFFARNIADVRPLFDRLPLLLIFLVAALTMRLWSEEQKTGTLEILLTLPVPVHRLVLGKFLAGFILVAIALFLTLGLPLTVASIGSLDWGPVIGGYLAALLVAGAYLAIGLCISSTTENQIVSLIATVAVCLLLYLPGTDAVASAFSVDTAEVLRRLGTGSRFASIARGVLDIRDLAYYAGLIALFLTLNAVLLQSKRWGTGERTVAVRRNTLWAVGLVALNVVALNLWLTPVGAARVDLTKGGVYSLTEPTRELLASLDEPLVIRGYFSQKTHPLLDPLVPQIRDLLREYEVIGGGKVRVSYVDPSQDEALETEAAEQYNIRSVPFRFSGRHEQSVVNAYFHVLIAYGDQHEVLAVDDLIEIDVVDIGDIKVRLGNLEYEIARSIRKVALGFQSVDALFASLAGKVELEAYLTPDTLPENLKELPARLESVTKALETESGGKLSYRMIEPDTDELKQKILKDYGFQPFATLRLTADGRMTQDVFYMYLLLKVGDRLALVQVPEDPTEAALRDAVMTAIKRAAPGFMRVVGLVTPPPGPPEQPMMPNMPPRPGRPPQTFDTLREVLSQTHEVRMVSLDGGMASIGDDIDVLILAGPENLDDKAKKAVDQFLMRGGPVIVLAGKYRLSPQMRDLAIESVSTGLEGMLEKYGVTLGDKLVLDTSNDSFPIPVQSPSGGMRLYQLAYPFFVKVPESRMDKGGIVTKGLRPVILHWGTAVKLAAQSNDGAKDGAKDGDAAKVDARVLLSSSGDSWLQADTQIKPDFVRYPEAGFGKPAEIPQGEGGPHPLAVTLVGTFESAFADEADKADDAKTDDESEKPERLIKQSPPDARLVVIGSSGFVSDALLRLSEQAGSRDVANNLQLVQNLVDWALEDTALLTMRTRTTAPTLDIPESERGKWEWLNIAFALIGLALVVGASRVVRKPAIDLAQVRRSSRSAGASRKSPSDDGKGAAGADKEEA